jgi:hypothetical protein
MVPTYDRRGGARRVVPAHEPPIGDRSDPLAGPASRLRVRGVAVHVVVVVDSRLRVLRGPVRRGSRQQMARVRPRNGLPFPPGQRSRLLPRLFHDAAGTHRVALVASSPPHRHHHRGAGSRDRLSSSAEPVADCRGLHRVLGHSRDARPTRPSCTGTYRRRCEGLRARGRARTSGSGVTRVRRRRRERRCGVPRAVDPGPTAPRRVAVDVRGVADGVLRAHPTCGAARRRARSPVEQSNRRDEPHLQVPVPQHELSRRAPPPADRPLPQPAPAEPNDRRSAGSGSTEHVRRLP